MGMDTAIREAVRDGFKEVLEELKTTLSALPAARQNAVAEALVDVEEAARRLGLAVSTVYQRAASLKLPSVKDGNRLLFRPADLDAYVARRRRSTSTALRVARSARRDRANKFSSSGVRGSQDSALQNAQDDDRPEAREPRHPTRNR